MLQLEQILNRTPSVGMIPQLPHEPARPKKRAVHASPRGSPTRCGSSGSRAPLSSLCRLRDFEGSIIGCVSVCLPRQFVLGNGRFEQCILIVVVTWFGLGPTLGNLLPPHAFSRRRVAFSAPPCLSSNEQCMHLDRLGLREHTYSLEVKVRLRRALIPHYVYYVVRSPLTLPRSSQYRSGRPLVTCVGRPPYIYIKHR